MWSLPERAQNRFDCHLGWARYAGVMSAESVEAMRIGGGEERFAVRDRDGSRPAIEIEPALVKMADLDRIEAINFLEEPIADRSAQDKKRVGREREDRVAAAGSQLAQIVESAQIFDFVRLNIEKNDVGPFEPHLGRLDKENSHRGGIGKDLRPIENLIVEGDGKRPEAEFACAFQELVGGVIQMILRVVERVDMEIELDPILFFRFSIRHWWKLDAGCTPRLRLLWRHAGTSRTGRGLRRERDGSGDKQRQCPRLSQERL